MAEDESQRDPSLQDTLAAQGIDADGRVSETLGKETLAAASVDSAPADSDNLRSARIAQGGEADFVVRSELGRGGMGTVLLAEDRSLGREVAIKRVTGGAGTALELLLREATVTGRLEHPNIVPVHALVRDEAGPAVVMKRVTGSSWEQLLERGDGSLDRHLEVFLQVCNAVAFAHSRGVVHRDIKPANIMIGDFGEVYLLDWGIAGKPDDGSDGQVRGTPQYMAPEMVLGRSDERSDVFMLGASLHEAVTGKPRHEGSTMLAVVGAAMRVEPFDYGPSVSAELADILNRACAPEPEDRYASVTQLRDAIAELRSHMNANDLSDAARERLVEMRDAVARRGCDPDGYVEVQRSFSETRFGFAQALRIWPESSAAKEGLRECLQDMVAYELDLEHVDAASALLDELDAPDDELAERVARAREQQERAQDRLSQLEADRDPSVGAEGRARAYAMLAVAVVVMTSVLAALRLWLPAFSPSTLRLSIVGAIVLATMVVVVLVWRARSRWNLVNRRIAQISVATVGVSFLQRIASLVAEVPPAQVLMVDAFLIGFGGLALSAFHRAGPWLAGVALSVAFAGAIWPAWVDDLFIGLSVFIPLLVLTWWRRRVS